MGRAPGYRSMGGVVADKIPHHPCWAADPVDDQQMHKWRERRNDKAKRRQRAKVSDLTIGDLLTGVPGPSSTDKAP
ncbi:hypothetical protein NDU88_009085 [Pleurodeles waltl]|uniref:Uncharacterized protein n=1 Tax=Pleurodeles waltl TaxID=8319 RepID=A0AAV7QTK9_PLEWA|nr:hypothetical protein NDU88_009085 [Pleurodeles waltl]